MSELMDLGGLRFGRFAVIVHAGKNHHGAAMWLCGCDCGKQANNRRMPRREVAA